MKTRAKWVILGVCAAGLIVAAFMLRWLPRREVMKQLEAIRAAGLPASPVELNAWYKPVTVKENQAFAILGAARARVEPPRDADPTSRRLGSLEAGHPLSPKMEEAIQAYLAANQEALSLLHEAAELTESRYPINLSLGPGTLLPHLAHVRNLVQLLRVDAVYRSHLGTRDQAVRSLTAALSVAGSLRNEPILVSEFTRMGCVALAVDGLERLLSEHPLTHEQLSSLAEKIAEAEAVGQHALFRGLVGERAIDMVAFNMSLRDLDGMGLLADSGDGLGALQVLAFQLYRAGSMHQRDLAFYLEMMNDLVTSAQGDFPGLLREFQRVDAEMMSTRFVKGVSGFAVSRLLLVNMTAAAVKEANFAARLRCSLAALAIERFRLDHDGALPETLEQLIPEYFANVPVDPFDGSALVYERFPGKDYRVISPAALADQKGPSKNLRMMPPQFSVGKFDE